MWELLYCAAGANKPETPFKEHRQWDNIETPNYEQAAHPPRHSVALSAYANTPVMLKGHSKSPT